MVETEIVVIHYSVIAPTSFFKKMVTRTSVPETDNWNKAIHMCQIPYLPKNMVE